MMNAYFKDRLIIKKITYDKYGTATEKKIACNGRFDFRTKLVRDLQGEMVVSSALVYLPIVNIAHKDKIVYNSVEYSILNIEEAKDFNKRFLRLRVA